MEVRKELKMLVAANLLVAMSMEFCKNRGVGNTSVKDLTNTLYRDNFRKGNAAKDWIEENMRPEEREQLPSRGYGDYEKSFIWVHENIGRELFGDKEFARSIKNAQLMCKIIGRMEE